MTTSTLLEEIEKEWAPFEEVRQALRCSRSKISRLIRDDVLKAKPFGRDKWIRRDSVKRYLDSIFSDQQPKPAPSRRRRKA